MVDSGLAQLVDGVVVVVVKGETGIDFEFAMLDICDDKSGDATRTDEDPVVMARGD